MKQIVMKKRGTILTVPGFGKVTDGVSASVAEAISKKFPELKAEFEEVEVKAETKAEAKAKAAEVVDAKK